MGNKESKPAKGAKGREKASTAQRKNRISKNQALKNASRQLSCMSRDKRTKREKDVIEGDKVGDAEKGHELAEHLRQITPFNGRWSVSKTINEGTYGVVFDAYDEKTKVQGVIKVAKSMSAGNQTTEWESYLLERIFRADPDASVVRILDRGMLADQDGNGMEFVVLEKAQVSIKDWLDSGNSRPLLVMDIAVQMLKGIADLHFVGLLHRDLKPDNMGIYSKETPICLLFDLGMSRMYTDGVGGIRAPRTVVPFRGTPEWASGHAVKGREQTRYDDLIAWLYVIVELMDPAMETNQPLPWTYRFQQKPVAILKSNYAPARILLRHCPTPFYAIYSYLMTANRLKPPDYAFIADRIKESKQMIMEKIEKERMVEKTANNQNTAEDMKTAESIKP